MKTKAARGEFDIIRRFFAPLARSEPGALDLTDDAAIVSVRPGYSLVVSTDTIIEGAHFFSGDTAADIAAKGLAVAFSDIAAMGATATAYTLSLSLPRVWKCGQIERWLGAFAEELRVEQQAIGVILVGGDTVATPGPLSLTLTVFGMIRSGHELRRSGARIGDLVYVSGNIGDGALGLSVLTGHLDQLDDVQREALARRFRRPTPRLALGLHLSGIAHSAVDVSDGLVADLGHICDASRVQANIEAARIPLSEPARAALGANPALMAQILSGGDDYELVFTAPPEAAESLARIAANVDLALTKIGRIGVRETLDTGPSVRVTGLDGQAFDPGIGGFSHF
jgi:thiamine-monophosphate kinase